MNILFILDQQSIIKLNFWQTKACMARPAEKHYLGNSVKAGSAIFKVGFWLFGGSPSKRCGIPLSFYVFVPMRHACVLPSKSCLALVCQVCVCPTLKPKTQTKTQRKNSRPSVAEVQIDITGVDNWYFEQFHAL